VARARAGEMAAVLAVEGMCYQVAKAVGAMAVALEGQVDAVILTGGMAHDPHVVEPVQRRVSWIAPVVVLPGEDEMSALAEGVLRVLSGEEAAN